MKIFKAFYHSISKGVHMKLLDIIKEDKIKLGIIIKYYRINDYKIDNPNSWSINHFIKDDSEYICSNITLSNIENLEIIENDEIYDRLLNKLNLKYNYEKNLSNIHEEYSNLIIEEFNNFNFHKLNIITDEYIQILSPFKDFILENEYLSALEFIKVHSNKINDSNIKLYEKNISKFVDIFNIYPTGIKELLYNFLIGISIQFYDTNKRASILENINIEDSKLAIVNIQYANYLIYIEDYYNAFDILIPIIKKYENENNIIGIISALPTKIRLMAETNSKNWIFQSKNAIKFILDNPCHNKGIVTSSLYNIALTLYLKNEYSLAYDIYIILIEEYNYLNDMISISVNVAGFLLEKPIPKKAIIKRDHFIKDKYIDPMYNFFVLKEEGASFEELEDYILTDIKPILKHWNKPVYYNYYNILEFLVNKTNNRDKLYKYKQLRKKSYDD